MLIKNLKYDKNVSNAQKNKYLFKINYNLLFVTCVIGLNI